MLTDQERVCPECGGGCAPDEVHVCPVASCCTIGPVRSKEVVCPYCGTRFQTEEGHVCVWLLRLCKNRRNKAYRLTQGSDSNTMLTISL